VATKFFETKSKRLPLLTPFRCVHIRSTTPSYGKPSENPVDAQPQSRSENEFWNKEENRMYKLGLDIVGGEQCENKLECYAGASEYGKKRFHVQRRKEL